MEQNTSKVLAEASAPAITTGTGTALFVINLCASMAPMATAAKTLPGLDRYRVYQVSRAEDGRTRYRLRLGFFTTEADAEQALATVRDQYPTAFTACLADEDRKFARGFLPDNSHAEMAPPARPQMAVVVDNESTRPLKALRQEVPTAAPTPVAAATASVAPALATPPLPAVPGPTSTVAKVSAAVATPEPATAVQPPAKAAAIEAPVIEIDWEPATPAAQVPADHPVGSAVSKLAPAAPATSDKPLVAATANAKPAVAPAKSTQQTTAPLPTSVATPIKPSAAPALELTTTSAPLPAPATPIHRGVVDAKAPSLDSIRLTLDTELGSDASPSKPAAPTNQQNQPFHVGKGVELPPTNLTLDTDGVAKQPATARDQSPKKSPLATQSASKSAASYASALSYDNLDSTQTIRALTAEELNDESQEKCFAIQLAVSEQPVNLDAMPHLDIFEAYRLYSIATAGSGKITHSLRIGFFREQVSAEAVSGYLRTFFPSPTIVRISLAEQARFKDPPPPRAPAAAPQGGESKVVALSEARARNARTTIPTVTMEVATPATVDTGATGSFRPNATGSFRPNATGSFKPSATGAHKAMKSAAKSSALPQRSAALASNKKSATGKHPALSKKPLSQQLLDEAREVELSESSIRKLPKSASLLARLVGKLSK